MDLIKFLMAKQSEPFLFSQMLQPYAMYRKDTSQYTLLNKHVYRSLILLPLTCTEFGRDQTKSRNLISNAEHLDSAQGTRVCDGCIQEYKRQSTKTEEWRGHQLQGRLPIPIYLYK